MTDRPSIFVFCALPCEARPLINAWRLKKLSTQVHPFAISTGSQKVVVITGIGKVAMAGAVGYTMALFANPVTPIMLNLGIAGHRDHVLGEICLGHKISDAETGRSFFPTLAINPPCQTETIVTHGQPHTVYGDDKLRDMEAAAFYELAVKFSTSELIQVIKVISDNAQSSIAKIDESAVEAWIGAKLALVDDVLLQLQLMRQKLTTFGEDPLVEELLTQFHFSVTNARKLRSLVLRWRLLMGDTEPAYRQVNATRAGDLLDWIERELDKSRFSL